MRAPDEIAKWFGLAMEEGATVREVSYALRNEAWLPWAALARDIGQGLRGGGNRRGHNRSILLRLGRERRKCLPIF